jgi:hypothetical protein
MSRVIPQWLRHRNRAALAAGLLGAVALALGTTASLGGFTASITNTGDKAQTGDLIMQEATTPTGGTTTTCLSTGAGATITTNANTACAANKFGALTNSVPGATSASVVVVTNQGSLPAATFTLGAGACTALGSVPPGATATNVGSDTAGFCSKVDVTVEDDTTAGTPVCIYPVAATACPALSTTYNLTTMSTFFTTPVALTAPLAAGAARTYKYSVGIDASATNADQAMAATEALTYTFGS